jgi:hypothetical protein
MSVYLWEILVPTVRPDTDCLKFFTARYHRVWDEKVRAISGGLTIMPPSKGQWVSPHGTVFVERMIPVRVIATRDQIEQISDFTADYYEQEAVMFYKISDEVKIKTYDRKNSS